METGVGRDGVVLGDGRSNRSLNEGDDSGRVALPFLAVIALAVLPSGVFKFSGKHLTLAAGI
ncbi:MAG: hypothetical protein ACFCBU_03550 [Cyanophyceae cyanobacterium]